MLAVVAALAATAYFSPLMSVRNVDVTGLTTLSRGQVIGVAEVQEGQPLLQVDTAAMAQRVALIPAVETVDVQRSYPSTLTIAVTERSPRALVDRDGKLGVMDRLGHVYLEYASREAMGDEASGHRRFRDLPLLSVPIPGPGDPTTEAALTVAGELPEWLAKQVTDIQASSPADIRLQLTKDRVAVWGDAERTADKADALRHVLKVDGSTYNVSSPEFPAVS